MTREQIIDSSFNKTKKSFLLYDLGFTRRDVAAWITNGNYGFAHNIWKKWNAQLTGTELEENQPMSIAPFDFCFDRTFGIELEVYGTSRERIIQEFQNQGVQITSEGYNHSTRNNWKIVSDSSILGENGCEIVSPVLRGQDGINQLKKVTIALNKAGAKVNTSCGFHVHFGESDFTLENFKMLAKNHINLENQFDTLVPDSRRGNNNSFCKSITHSAGSKAATFQKINQSNTINKIVNCFGGRYLKLNFQSYLRQGTVEVRHHSGTTTFSKIKNWVLICARLIEASKQNKSVNNLNEILNESLQEYIADRAVDLAA